MLHCHCIQHTFIHCIYRYLYKIYLFWFSQRPQPVHGLELSLLFGSALLTANGLVASAGYPQQQQPYARNYSNKQDASYSEVIMALFANFARSG